MVCPDSFSEGFPAVTESLEGFPSVTENLKLLSMFKQVQLKLWYSCVPAGLTQ
jgi:hypothetical protein